MGASAMVRMVSVRLVLNAASSTTASTARRDHSGRAGSAKPASDSSCTRQAWPRFGVSSTRRYVSNSGSGTAP
jgi:hypothetical protein